MPFVLDASVAASWGLADEDDPIANLALERIANEEALVPSLWWFEMRNILIMSERRGRLTEAATDEFLADLSRFRVTIDEAPTEAAFLSFARRHRLTVYDASYLELAARQSIPLATLDSALAQAARREGVALIGD